MSWSRHSVLEQFLPLLSTVNRVMVFCSMSQSLRVWITSSTSFSAMIPTPSMISMWFVRFQRAIITLSHLICFSLKRRIITSDEVGDVKFNYKKAYWDGIISEISEVDWINLLADKQCDQLWDIFHSELSRVIHKYVPVLRNRVKGKKTKYPKKICRLQTRKLASWKRWKETGSELCKNKYFLIAKECRQAIYQGLTIVSPYLYIGLLSYSLFI